MNLSEIKALSRPPLAWKHDTSFKTFVVDCSYCQLAYKADLAEGPAALKMTLDILADFFKKHRHCPVPNTDCTGEGRCHGPLSWCDFCGDVSQVCDAKTGECDCHHPCLGCGRLHSIDYDCGSFARELACNPPAAPLPQRRMEDFFLWLAGVVDAYAAGGNSSNITFMTSDRTYIVWFRGNLSARTREVLPLRPPARASATVRIWSNHKGELVLEIEGVGLSEFYPISDIRQDSSHGFLSKFVPTAEGEKMASTWMSAIREDLNESADAIARLSKKASKVAAQYGESILKRLVKPFMMQQVMERAAAGERPDAKILSGERRKAGDTIQEEDVWIDIAQDGARKCVATIGQTVPEDGFIVHEGFPAELGPNVVIKPPEPHREWRYWQMYSGHEKQDPIRRFRGLQQQEQIDRELSRPTPVQEQYGEEFE